MLHDATINAAARAGPRANALARSAVASAAAPLFRDDIDCVIFALLVFQRLVTNYSPWRHRFSFENSAIARVGGTRAFHYFDQTDTLAAGYDQLGSLDRQCCNSARAFPGARMVRASLNCLTFRQLYEKHNVRRLDLLHIDAEGADAEILEQVDFRKYQPSVVLYEHKHLSEGDQENVNQMLDRAGYKCVRIRIDTLAVRRAALTAFSNWQPPGDSRSSYERVPLVSLALDATVRLSCQRLSISALCTPAGNSRLSSDGSTDAKAEFAVSCGDPGRCGERRYSRTIRGRPVPPRRTLPSGRYAPRPACAFLTMGLPGGSCEAARVRTPTADAGSPRRQASRAVARAAPGSAGRLLVRSTAP